MQMYGKKTSRPHARLDAVLSPPKKKDCPLVSTDGYLENSATIVRISLILFTAINLINSPIFLRNSDTSHFVVSQTSGKYMSISKARSGMIQQVGRLLGAIFDSGA